MITRQKQRTPDRLQELDEAVGFVRDVEMLATHQPKKNNQRLLRELRSQQRKNKKQQQQKEVPAPGEQEDLASGDEEAPEH
ncbi:hypothetical protein SUGI_0735550 [Cryptomeria japonica]|nr:hypothetical protein SUGI_0735550 [Cryptomeria japonica]